MRNGQMTSKKSNAPIFSFGIFRESVRRLRLVTVLMTVFLSFSVLLTPVLAVIEAMSAPDFSFETLSAVSVDAFSYHSTLLTLFILAAPIVAFTLFSHLTSRRESDFYHALPYTRTCLYLSLMAAAAVSLLFMILVPTLLSALIYTIFSRFFYLSLSKLFIFAFGCFAGALSVLAACSLAASLTGTRLSAVAVTGMILFLPRIVISMMTATLANALPMVTPGHVAPLFESTASYVFGFVSYVFAFATPTLSPTAHAYNLPAIFYTLCLTVVYLSVALCLFRKRKSETAEKPAPSRRLQALYRIAVAFFCSLFVCDLLFTSVLEGSLKGNLPTVLVSYLLVFAAYCLYELFTARRVKSVLRAMPTFGIVLLLNAALLLTMGGIYHSRLSFTPEKEEIRSVSIMPDPHSENADTLTFYEYVREKTASLALTDENSREIVARALADCVKTYRESETRYDYTYHYTHHNSHGTGEGYTSLDLKIVTEDGAHYRTLYLPKDDAAALQEKISTSERYQSTLASLPKPQKNTLTLSASGNAFSFRGEVAESLFATFCDEMKGLSAEEKARWWQLSEGSNCYFSYSVDMGARSVRLFLEVSPSLFPRTNARFLELAADKQLEEGTVTAVKSALSHKDAADAYQLNFTVRDEDGRRFAQLEGAPSLENAKEALSMMSFRAPNGDEAEILLTAFFFDERIIGEKYAYSQILLVGCVKQAELDAFLDLIGYGETNIDVSKPLPIQ